MADHAAASPSSAGMWMPCPASVTQAAGRTRPSSRYAREGTAAHTIAEMILSGELFPPPKIRVEGEEFIVGLPMLLHLRPYITIVEGLRASGAHLFIEQRVGLPGGLVWGTTDCSALTDTTLDVVDLKFGKGVKVSPDSAQLKIYALSSITTLFPGRVIRKVRLTISQPRIDPVPQTVEMSIGELMGWYADELQPAVQRIHDGDPTEVYGHWCRWCVRRDECKAFKMHKNALASDVFDDAP